MRPYLPQTGRETNSIRPPAQGLEDSYDYNTLMGIAFASVSGENPEDEIKSGREVNEKNGDSSQKS